MQTLYQLHADIAERAGSIASEHPDWPCRMGCDNCCRRLADLPQLTAPEWALLREGLAGLPRDERAEITQSLWALASAPESPVVCPFLDLSKGLCRVYAHRPLACRSYGFYLERGVGLYCRAIEDRVSRGEFDHVIWGNQAALESHAKTLGPRRPVTEWFADWALQNGSIDLL